MVPGPGSPGWFVNFNGQLVFGNDPPDSFLGKFCLGVSLWCTAYLDFFIDLANPLRSFFLSPKPVTGGMDDRNCSTPSQLPKPFLPAQESLLSWSLRSRPEGSCLGLEWLLSR